MVQVKGWWSTEVDDTNIHTHPDNDLIDHDLDVDCVCLPDVETVERDNGEIVFLAHHHSIDGREAQEVEANGMGAWQ